MQACSLSANNIACRRGDRLLFRGVSLDLKAGDAVHITGTNGIGKTSLMRILSGLLRPFEGVIERDGAVGLIDENPALDPQVPLGKALGFWAEMDGADKQAQGVCAGRMGLSQLLDVPFRYLSTGQRKRAALARLQCQQAPIWLLDEPLNGLDTDGIALVEQLIADHTNSGGIAVIASHQPISLTDGKTLVLQEFTA